MIVAVIQRAVIAFAALLVLGASAIAQDRALPPGEIRANGGITFGNALKLGKRENNRIILTPDALQILESGSANLPTPDTYDGSTKAATTAYVQNFFKQRQGNTVSPFDYCTGPCGKGQTNDTAAVQAALNAMVALQALFVQSPALDLRGGMFAVNAPLTMTGAPYSMTFGNGSIIPFNGYSGDFFDFSGTTATTKLRFLGLVLNGYNTARHLIRLGPKTQGTTVMFSSFFNWTGRAILDPTTVAATENQINNNVFEGAPGFNRGTAVEVFGNDSEINDNIIYNVATGIRLHAGSHTISRNHIYSATSDIMIPLIDAETGDGLQINDNYLDQGYIRVKDPSGLQAVSNRWFATTNTSVTPPSTFGAIVLVPSGANAEWVNILITSNQFKQQFAGGPAYSPIRVDTTSGSVGTLYNVHMKDNGFFGYREQTTEPTGSVSGTNTSSFGVNLSAKIPFGVLAAVESVVCSFGMASINSIGIGSGDPFNKTVYVGTAANQNGSCRVKATVNSN
jgi:hypothetical protein